jgi:hypothetical protein
MPKSRGLLGGFRSDNIELSWLISLALVGGDQSDTTPTRFRLAPLALLAH